MARFPISTSDEHAIYAALELSKNSWLLAIQALGRRSQGIAKAGNRLARVAVVEAAWLWVRHQPDSALTQWFHDRTQGQKGRIRRVMIVALARKLAIALWRYLETGLIPEGAVVK